MSRVALDRKSPERTDGAARGGDSPPGAGRAAGGQAEVPQAPARQRLLALDTFRGFVIGGMLVVNNIPWNAATPRQLEHAPWGQGITFTDLILPWFVLAMGVAIPQSGVGRAAPGGLWGRLWRISRRAVLLVLLGMGLDSAHAGHLVLGIDVLQLLGLAYLVGALLAGWSVAARLGTAAALLAGYGALLAFVPAPGMAPGVLREGHNIVHYLNDAYLARFGLAGLLSVVPAGALVLIGTLAGDAVRGLPAGVPMWRALARATAVTVGGVALAYGGWGLGQILPLNKALWTPSYALVAGGLGLALLGVLAAVLDVARWRWLGTPLAVLGTNAILAYVAPIVFKLLVLDAEHVRTPAGTTVTLESWIIAALTAHLGPVPALWLYTGAFVLVWWLLLLPLYRGRAFVRL